MAIRTPNPCDGVVEEQAPQPSGDSEPQGAHPATQFQGDSPAPIFSERTIERPSFNTGRTLSMIDEEFSLEFIPPLYMIDGPPSDNPRQGIHVPSWFYNAKRVTEGARLRRREDNVFDKEKIDPLRAGALLTWVWKSGHDDQRAAFINPGLITMHNIPVSLSTENTEDREWSEGEGDNIRQKLGTRSDIIITPTPEFTRIGTAHYADFGGDGGVDKFYDTYYYGPESTHYQGLDEKAKDFYKIGLIPTGDPVEKTFVDSVFECPLPYHRAEADFLNIPTFNVVDISLESKGFVTKAFGIGDIVHEFQKPSIYRAFYEEKALENLEPNIVINDGSPLCDRVQKFTSDRVETMKAANEKIEKQSESFIRVQIATRQGADNSIAQMLRNNKMDRHVLDMISSTGPSLQAGENFQSTYEVFTQIMQDVVGVADDDGRIINPDQWTSNDQTQNGVFFKINHMLEDKIRAQINIRDVEFSEDYLKQYPMGFFNHDNPGLLSFEDAITSQIFLQELHVHAKENKLQRSFSEIMSGRKAHAEVIAYHVEKADADSGEVIQDFYFSDSNEVLEIDFVDNQILKGKRYRYRVYAVNIIMSTRYTYGDLVVNSPGAGIPELSTIPVRLPVTTELQYSIVETPYFEKVISVFDKPPMFPQVNFLPYQGVEDEIGFLLQDNGGESLESPIVVLDADEEKFISMAEAQNKREGTPLLFGSDDLPTAFEALCITHDDFEGDLPTSYRDFAQVERPMIKRIPASGKTGFYKMKIKPNKYYYIIFRTIEDEMISNPTEVYRFMMVSYANGIYFDVQTVELEPLKEYNPITFERILKIEPILQQYLLDVGPSGDSAQNLTDFARSAPEISLDDVGTAEEELWGKRLKFRIRSRSTGKEIDLKVVFNKELKHRDNLVSSEQETTIEVCTDEE